MKVLVVYKKTAYERWHAEDDPRILTANHVVELHHSPVGHPPIDPKDASGPDPVTRHGQTPGIASGSRLNE